MYRRCNAVQTLQCNVSKHRIYERKQFNLLKNKTLKKLYSTILIVLSSFCFAQGKLAGFL